MNKNVHTVPGSDHARSTETHDATEHRVIPGKQARAGLSAVLDENEMTVSGRLAREYLRLGGRRLAKIDDNITTLRQWEEDPPEAERFWTETIQPLSEQDRKQVENMLPTINTH